MLGSNESLLTIALFELGHPPVTPAIPRLHTFVFHIKVATFKLSKQSTACSNRWSVFTIMILPAKDDFPQPFSYDYTSDPLRLRSIDKHIIGTNMFCLL